LTNQPVTVGDLAALIEAREEVREELHELSLRAHQQCCELEARLQELEQRLDHSYDDISSVRLVGSLQSDGRTSGVMRKA
jgi:hypothetical protein